MRVTNYNKAVLTHSAQPCHYPSPTLGTKMTAMV